MRKYIGTKHVVQCFSVLFITLSTLIIINGEEEFLKERAAFDEAKSSLIDNIFQYNYKKELSNYLNEIQITPLSDKPRVFIIRESEAIPELPFGISDMLIVVAKNKPLKDGRAKRTYDFPKLKTYDSNNQVIKWILDEGRSLNIDLSLIASALFVNHGKSLRKISSEINKLAVLTPPGDSVRPEIARFLICFSAELTPREIVDAVCEGHAARALAFYDKLQERADETGWIIAYLQRHVLQYITIDFLTSGNTPSDKIIERIGVHPFVYKNVILPNVGLWTKQSLLQSLDVICDLDIAHKRGDESARLGLELEIVRLSEEAKNVKRRGHC